MLCCVALIAYIQSYSNQNLSITNNCGTTNNCLKVARTKSDILNTRISWKTKFRVVDKKE